MLMIKIRLTRLILTAVVTLLFLSLPAITLAADDFSPLVGRWQRTDGGYIIHIRNIDSNGKIDAAYFNPRPINVSHAQALKHEDKVKIELELRDVGYPGSAYNLVYIPVKDMLFGYYYHATSEQFFDVTFVRMR